MRIRVKTEAELLETPGWYRDPEGDVTNGVFVFSAGWRDLLGKEYEVLDYTEEGNNSRYLLKGCKYTFPMDMIILIDKPYCGAI